MQRAIRVIGRQGSTSAIPSCLTPRCMGSQSTALRWFDHARVANATVGLQNGVRQGFKRLFR